MKSTSVGQGSIMTAEEKRRYELNAETRQSRAFQRQFGRIARELENDRRRSRQRGAPAAQDDSDG